MPALLPLVPAFAAAAAPIPLYNLYRTERLIFGALSSALSRPRILRACGGLAAAPTLLSIVAGRNPHAGTSRNDAGVRDKIAAIAPAARTATADHLGQNRAGAGKRL